MLRAVDETLQLRRRGARLTLASVLGVPLTAVVVGSLPLGWRTVAYVLALTLVAGCGLVGGWTSRTALQQGAPHPVRTIAVSVVGLTIGLTAGIFALTALVGAIL
jgi:hypothetical protein